MHRQRFFLRAIHYQAFEALNAVLALVGCALASLPPNQRQAVELIHLKGLSVVDAAAQAGVTPGALKVRAHRGYRALRRRLQEAGW